MAVLRFVNIKVMCSVLVFILTFCIVSIVNENKAYALDAAGSGGEFFMRATYSEKYFLEPGSVIATNTYDMSQRLFAGASNQKFKIYSNGDGSYKIQWTGNNTCLSVENNSVADGARIITSPWTGDNSQKWFFNRNSDGTYSILNKRSGKSFTNSGSGGGYDGSRLVQWPVRSYLNYTLETTYKGEYNIYGMCGFTGAFTTQARNNLMSFSASSVNFVVGTNAALEIRDIQNSTFTYFDTHAYWDKIFLTGMDSNGQTYTTYLYFSDLYYLPDYSLTNERCVVYFCCSAGEGGQDAINMVNVTASKGAKSVIGWTTVINVNSGIWGNAFFDACGQGKTLPEAVNTANIAHWNVYGNPDISGLANYYIAGSSRQKLTS
ncbi:MAG: hypothetical protein BGN88_15530 [Clostridiales bacterium 43-6]|nr:MAG: hypothetical protein BGN88_15530 [Clostridiales bacterium 43-6]